MWRITIIANAIMMWLFWIASLLATSLAHNKFVQYADSSAPTELPLPTELALSTQIWLGILPLSWILLSNMIWHKIKNKEPGSRSEYLLAFTVLTMITGMFMLIFFALSGMLPFFFIGGIES